MKICREEPNLVKAGLKHQALFVMCIFVNCNCICHVCIVYLLYYVCIAVLL